MRLGIMLMSLVLMLASAHAAGLYDPRHVVYGGQRLWVRIAPGQITRLVLPEPLTEQRFALSPSAATLSVDPSDARQLVIEAIDPEAEAQVSVSTTRQVYVVVLRRAKRADSVVHVKHPPPPPPEQHAAPDPRAGMRAFWLSQWWGRSVSPDIRVEPVRGALAQSDTQAIRYVAYTHGLGYYGWTLRLTNTSEQVQVIDIEALQDASGRLLAVTVQRQRPVHPLGRLAPGESMRLHLTYVAARP